MTSNKGSNPFKPGDGQLPPYLAGREKEQAIIREYLTNLRKDEPLAADILMYGPRGMGKTALLGWIENETEKSESEYKTIRTSRVTPDKLKSPADMWGWLLPDNWIKRRLPNKVSTSVVALAATWEERGTSNQVLENALIKKCNKEPLVFLVDEAHTMDPDLCRGLLNLSQIVRREAPFLLILAGTPGLRQFLATVGASFIERSSKMSIGRLDRDAAAEAIVKPLNEQGIEITADALARVIEDSQCYPYFIQEWGKSLWNEANKANLTRLTDEQVDIAEPNVNGEKQSFYAERWSRLLNDGLLQAAEIIAEGFRDTAKYVEIDLVLLMRDALPADKTDDQHIANLLQKLTQQDFIWRPAGTDLYEAGIPSLMTYVLDQQRG